METLSYETLVEKAKEYISMQQETNRDIRAKGIKTPFEFFYLFSNENLSFLFKCLDVEGKSILTVGSSGDQALYAHGYGARSIVHFDINPFSKMYFDYKVSAIKELSYKEFKRFFNNRKYPTLSTELYSRISHSLPVESRLFWDELYSNGFGSGEVRLHKNDSGDMIYSKADYEKIQEALYREEPDIRFITADLQNVSDQLKSFDKFDYILLSNIYNYIDSWKTQEPAKVAFRNSVDSLTQHLNPGGSMQIGYLWQDVSSNAFIMGHDLGLNHIQTIQTPLDEGSVMYTPMNYIKYPETDLPEYTS